MSAFRPSRLNKALAGLFCASLWRKGALCCTMSCSCFNDVENPEAERHRAEEARWKYQSEKLAARREDRQRAAERREARKSARGEAKSAKREAKSKHQARTRSGAEREALQSAPDPATPSGGEEEERQAVDAAASPPDGAPSATTTAKRQERRRRKAEKRRRGGKKAQAE